MRNAIFPALIVAAVVGTVYAMTSAPGAQAEEQAAVKLPVSELDVVALTPYLHKAAKELGYARIRGYDNSVFVPDGDNSINFFRENGALTMHVEVETRFRHAKSERAAVIKELQDKGERIFQQAVSLQAREEARDAVASTGSRRPAG